MSIITFQWDIENNTFQYDSILKFSNSSIQNANDRIQNPFESHCLFVVDKPNYAAISNERTWRTKFRLLFTTPDTNEYVQHISCYFKSFLDVCYELK